MCSVFSMLLPSVREVALVRVKCCVVLLFYLCWMVRSFCESLQAVAPQKAPASVPMPHQMHGAWLLEFRKCVCKKLIVSLLSLENDLIEIVFYLKLCIFVSGCLFFFWFTVTWLCCGRPCSLNCDLTLFNQFLGNQALLFSERQLLCVLAKKIFVLFSCLHPVTLFLLRDFLLTRLCSAKVLTDRLF